MAKKARIFAAGMVAALFILTAALPLAAADRVVQLHVPGCTS